MRKLVFLFAIPYMTLSQVPGTNGLNMPGTWDNAFQNPPSNPAFGGNQTLNGRIQLFTNLNTPIFQTSFSVNTSGADVTGGTYQWLFTSGPVNAPQSHLWSDVVVLTNTVQTYTYYTNTPGFANQVTLSNGKWYTVNWLNSGTASTEAIFLETSGQPVNITNVTTSQAFNDVYIAPMQVTITTSGTPAADQLFFIRFSTDNFTTSQIGQFTMSGNTGTYTIPMLTGGEQYSFYVFSTSIANILANQTSQYYDLRTITVNNNGGSNYTFFVNNSAITTSTGGNFFNPTTWRGGVMPSTPNITVAGGATLTNNSQIYLTNLTVQTGATFTSTGNVFFNANAIIQNSGTITLDGTSATLGSATISGTINIGSEFYINGAVTFNTSPIVQSGKTLYINPNGQYLGQSPIYEIFSNLVYVRNNTTFRGQEWTAGGGATVGVTPGYPYNISISGSGTHLFLNPQNTQYSIGGSLYITSNNIFGLDGMNDSNLIINGDLEIFSAGTLIFGNATKRTVVEGSVILGGFIVLSNQPGGDIEVKGSQFQIGQNGNISTLNNAIIFGGQNTLISAPSPKFYTNWVIQPGCTLTTSSFNVIEPIGSIVNNGYINCNGVISLISTFGQPNEYAKLLNNGTIGGSGTILRQLTLQTGLPNSNPASSDFNDGKNGRWYTIGVPYSNVAVSSVSNPTSGVIFNNTHPTVFFWNPNTGNYESASVFSNFQPNQGYAIYMGENQHGIFTRNFTVDDRVGFSYSNPTNPPLTSSFGFTSSPIFQNISGNNSGWNMAVNPFLTAYNLKNTQVSDAVATAHIYNPNTGSFMTYNFNEPTDFWIAPNQAFWVRALSAGGSITFNPANQSISPSASLVKPQSGTEYAFLKLHNGADEDLLRMYFRSEATDAFDAQYDADKMPRDAGKAMIYTTSSCNTALAVDARPVLTGYKQVPLFVTGSVNSALTIELDDYTLSNVSDVILEDKLTHTFHSLTNGGYTFQHTSIHGADRFVLHFGAPAVGADEVSPAAKSLQSWYSNEFIHILSEKTFTNGSCEIIDMMGRVVKKFSVSVSAGQRSSFSISDLPMGTYVLRVQSGTTVSTQKFVK